MTRIAVLLNQYSTAGRAHRESVIRMAASPDIDLGFMEMPDVPGGSALTDFHRSMAAPHVARSALAAEAAGYEAIVMWGTLDLGVEEARHVVDIPVIGPGRAACMGAATLVERFGVICHGDAQVPMFRKLVRGWRVDDRIVAIRSAGIVAGAITDPDPSSLRSAFIAAGQQLADEGAQAVVPLGLSMVPLTFAARDLSPDIGLPVLDPMAIALCVADALAVTGFTNSRCAYPSASIQ